MPSVYGKGSLRVAGPEEDSVLLYEALLPLIKEPVLVNWGWAAPMSSGEGFRTINYPSGLELASDKAIAFRVLRWARCPAVRTYEPRMLASAIYPIMGWKENSLYGQPFSILTSRRAQSLMDIEFFSPTLDVKTQSILHIVRNEVVWAETYDKEKESWVELQVVPEEDSLQATKAIYHLGLDTAAVRLIRTPKDSFVAGIGWPRLNPALAKRYAEAICRITGASEEPRILMGADCELIIINSVNNEWYLLRTFWVGLVGWVLMIDPWRTRRRSFRWWSSGRRPRMYPKTLSRT